MSGSDPIRNYYEGRVEPIYRVISGPILHLGIFRDGDTREAATARTKSFLASHLELDPGALVADLGSGYADAARYLAGRFGCRVLAVNLVHAQNTAARRLNRDSSLEDAVVVIEGDFRRVPLASSCFRVVWSQEALLHAPDRATVIGEAARLLAPAGRLIFTDLLQIGPMTAEEARSILERVHAESLETFESYCRYLVEAGLELRAVVDLSAHVAPSYQELVNGLQRHRQALEQAVGADFLQYTIGAMEGWVRAARERKLGWGMFLSQKP